MDLTYDGHLNKRCTVKKMTAVYDFKKPSVLVNSTCEILEFWKENRSLLGQYISYILQEWPRFEK
jgi:hypothetical protein